MIYYLYSLGGVLLGSNYAKIKGSNEIYEVYRIENGKVLLRNGNISVNTILDNIEILDDYDKNISKGECKVSLNDFDYKNEIMLRHMTKYEALDNLDKFVDQMRAHRVPLFKIIHGRSGGILREAVHEYLSSNVNVKSFRLGNYYEGGIGVTIVLLK